MKTHRNYSLEITKEHALLNNYFCKEHAQFESKGLSFIKEEFVKTSSRFVVNDARTHDLLIQ